MFRVGSKVYRVSRVLLKHDHALCSVYRVCLSNDSHPYVHSCVQHHTLQHFILFTPTKQTMVAYLCVCHEEEGWAGRQKLCSSACSLVVIQWCDLLG